VKGSQVQILSARPFKKRQLVGVFLWALADSGLELRTSRFNEAFQQRMLRNKNAQMAKQSCRPDHLKTSTCWRF
jgi:hypothetical protein